MEIVDALPEEFTTDIDQSEANASAREHSERCDVISCY